MGFHPSIYFVFGFGILNRARQRLPKHELQQEFDFGEKLANHIVDEHVRGRASRNALGVVQTIFVGNLQCAEHVEIVGDHPYGSIIVTDQLLAVDNVFLSGF